MPRLAETLAAAETALILALEARAEVSSSLDLDDRSMLRRFLVARHLQVDKAVEMICDHAAWRKATLPVQLTEQMVVELKKEKMFVRGTDLQGRPLVTIRSAAFDPKTRDLSAALLSCVHQLEAAIANMPCDQTRFALLYDRTGFRIKNLDIDLLREGIKLLSSNYPERLGAVYVYPAGAIASTVFKVVTVFMDPRTAAKVEMVRSPARLAEVIALEHSS